LKIHKNKVLVETPIYLTVLNEEMINLTLIDLPGLTYEKKEFIECNQILIKKYIDNENSIILLVVHST
jgi:GTP-binding protein EngB required for normal cell division